MNNLGETFLPHLKSKSHAKLIGVVVVLLAHVGILRLMMLTSSASLELPGMEGWAQQGTEGTAPVFDVALNPSSRPEARTPTPKASSSFERFEKLTDANVEVVEISKSEPAKPAQSLTAALGEDVFKPASKATGTKTDAKVANIKIDGKSTQSLNDLWKAIEPCWRRNATKDTQSVTLTVSFSPLGNLSKPPVIERPNGSNLDNQRLRSEAQAINALSQCGPYMMAFGQQNVSVRFPVLK